MPALSYALQHSQCTLDGALRETQCSCNLALTVACLVKLSDGLEVADKRFKGVVKYVASRYCPSVAFM